MDKNQIPNLKNVNIERFEILNIENMIEQIKKMSLKSTGEESLNLMQLQSQHKMILELFQCEGIVKKNQKIVIDDFHHPIRA